MKSSTSWKAYQNKQRKLIGIAQRRHNAADQLHTRMKTLETMPDTLVRILILNDADIQYDTVIGLTAFWKAQYSTDPVYAKLRRAYQHITQEKGDWRYDPRIRYLAQVQEKIHQRSMTEMEYHALCTMSEEKLWTENTKEINHCQTARMPPMTSRLTSW